MEQIDFVDQQQPETRAEKRRRGRPARSGSTAAPRARSGGVRDGHRRLTADIPSDLHKRLKMQALMEDRSVTDLIVQAAEFYLRKSKEG